MATGQEFWTEFLTLLEGGNLTSVPDYYLPNSGGVSTAQAGEWGNIIEKIFKRTPVGSAERVQLVDMLDEVGFWDPRDDLDFWKTDPLSDDPAQYSSLQDAAEERMPDMFDGQGNTQLEGGVNVNAGGQGISVGESDQATKDAENQLEAGVGGGGEGDVPLTILTGEEMKWYLDSSTGKWYVEYGLPNSERSVLFEADPDQLDALFGENQRPTKTTMTLKGILSQGAIFSGNIGKMAGTGAFESEINRVLALGADGDLLPEWATESGTVMDLVYVAQAEGKSQEWLIEQISKTSEFSARFPNISKFKTSGNLTTVEAITGFLEFEAGVKASVEAINGSGASVTPEVIGGLLDRGHSLPTVQVAIGKFDRMQKFAPAFDAFNQILVAQGKDPITSLQDMFDFVSGDAPVEVYEVWEASSIAEAASNAGLGDVFTAEDAINYALQTEQDFDLGSATKGFQDAASLLLRMRHEVDVGKFDINQDDLIDLSLGQPMRSGSNMADVSANIQRAVLGAQKNLQGRVNPFKGFTSGGAVTSQSLGSLRNAQ